MRASDKKNNMKKANKLAESLYMKTKNEGYDYAAAEREFHDRQDYERSVKLEELGASLEEVLQNLHGNWSVKKINDTFIITNTSIPNKEMEVGLSIDRPEFSDGDYTYYYELKSVNPKADSSKSGHQGNFVIQKTRFNNPAHLFISGKYPYELWFN